MEPSLYWYSICAVVLFLKMFALAGYQGFHRIGKRTFTNPEDAGFLGGVLVREELPAVRRAARAWLNDLENIPIFLALGVAYVLLGASPVAAPWLFLGFTAARVVHTVVYLVGVQPWRTISYAIGIVCTLGMCAAILAALL